MDFSRLLQLMTDKKASDLFIGVGIPPSLKINGRITPVSKTKLNDKQTRELLFSLLSPAQREEFTNTNECNFAISEKGVGRFRVSAFVQRDSVGMVLRRIENKIPRFDSLHLPPVMRELAMLKRGLVVFVGPTGSGKSTSLAAMVGYRNRKNSGHIITIEDPIEFAHSHDKCVITQREVGIDTESYEVALKNALRQAPDVVMIGEIRTKETMEYALAFAETGHLCLSTLHANNADQALDRIISFFPEEARNQVFMDLSLNLRAIVAQQLIPCTDGESRCPAVEVLINTPLAADIIRKGEVHKLKELMKASEEQGMSTFDKALYILYNEGKISYEDAILHADSANEVRLMVKLESVDVEKNAENMSEVSIASE